MPKTTRERIIVIATILVALAAFAYSRLEKAGVISTLRENAGGDLSAKIEQYQEYEDILGREAKINAEFAKIEKPYRRTPGYSPEKDFQIAVSNLCRKHGFVAQVDPPELEKLENVEEWGLVLVNTQFKGDFKNAADLLKEIDAGGYLIETLRIAQVRQDFEEVSVELEVARPVKLKDVPAFDLKSR